MWLDHDIKVGETWQAAIEKALRAHDYILVLYSDAARRSNFVHEEILQAQTVRESSDRAITVIPVALYKTPLPDALRELYNIDFSAERGSAIAELVAEFRAAPELIFPSPHREFQALVEDLLVALGFDLRKEYHFHGRVFDFSATLKTIDPFGREQVETWVIELKNYRNQRPGSSVVHQLIEAFSHLPQGTRFAFITSSQLTSAARQFLEATVIPVWLIEGVELKRIRFPTRTSFINTSGPERNERRRATSSEAQGVRGRYCWLEVL